MPDTVASAVVLDLAALADALRLLARQATNATTNNPPTTPPTMAPMAAPPLLPSAALVRLPPATTGVETPSTL